MFSGSFSPEVGAALTCRYPSMAAQFRTPPLSKSEKTVKALLEQNLRVLSLLQISQTWKIEDIVSRAPLNCATPSNTVGALSMEGSMYMHEVGSICRLDASCPVLIGHVLFRT